ncbi:Protein CBG26100 [Caenorhabditis briggsae]|uniref:Protein CBG26100 n=2 Tax=Caenorhabditis briggsae TaxID=6238 RepID=B6IM85_CAEBR|nr:Protein CBG26100 [Caenorhabditis briggsae]CAS01015.1 Protein CBG26100 [Caenorhabditis briggsae]
MSPAFEMCTVCEVRANVELRYGAVCCNACRIFFYRNFRSLDFPSECQTPGQCQENWKWCEYCHFKQCVSAGMRPPLKYFLER